MQIYVQVEELLKAEKQVKYKSTVQVRLERLLFKELRKFDKKNVKRLKTNFCSDYCQLDIRNHISALID